MRAFKTGATRDTLANKPQYVGFLSWQAIKRFGQYMLNHQVQADGSFRDADNWKKGIPLDAYRDSLTRHVVDFNDAVDRDDLVKAEELACAIWFNIQGWLHERLRR